MNIKQTKRTLKGLPPRHSVLLEGRHGIGKSEVVAQTAAELSKDLKIPYGFIDIRLGQYEVGDLIGIPRTRDTFTVSSSIFKDGSLTKKETVAENVTAHDLPLWFPRDQESYGFMFFDELNRGSRDTQQWSMQIVLDYKSNFVEVPQNWRVVAACNDDQDVYSILNMDPALYDRFLVIKFKPLISEWMEYAEKTKVHDAIIKYIRKFGSDLDAPEKIESGKRYPSRRSWVKLSNTIHHLISSGDNPLEDFEYLTLLASGYVGSTVAVNFVEFIKKEYTVYNAEEILNNFPKIQKDFEKMIATDFTFYNKEIVAHIKQENLKLNKKQSENLFSYVQVIQRETAAGFWGEFHKECPTQSTTWYKSNPDIMKYIRDLLSKEASMA